MYRSKFRDFFESISSVVKGQTSSIELILVSFLARGHVLLEGIPGTGKTTLSLAFARLLGLDFNRIQGTSDMLPADITGAYVPRKSNAEYVFLKGPVFTDILLVDEINRMNPRTQSALLEAMEERQVTVEGKTYRLSPLFFVIATQNPSESYGTFPLPASQLDRFMMRIEINRVSEKVEMEILKEGRLREKIGLLSPIFGKGELMDMVEEIKRVMVSEEVRSYLLSLAREVRLHPAFSNELSTRALLHILDAAKALGFIKDRNFVVPDDIKTVFTPLVLHRIGFSMSFKDKEKLVDEIKNSVEPPL